MKRSSPLKRRSWIKRGTKPIPKINLARAQRKRDAYAAHLKSAYFRDIKRQVRERSGGRCERTRDILKYGFGTARCLNRAAVYNHTTYARFGRELLEDIEHICVLHNEEYENARSHRAAKRLLMRSMEAAS